MAIDPEDIITRKLDDFEQQAGEDVSKDRIQLRYEYYEEKRMLKLKAIENVLAKCQMTNRNGQPNQEAMQVMALLDDMKINKSLFDGNSTKRSTFWSFNSPNKTSSSKPRNTKGSFYSTMKTSVSAMKTKKIIDKLPANLIDYDCQEELRNKMVSTFSGSPVGSNK